MSQLDLDYQTGLKPFPWAGMVLLFVASLVLALVGIYYRGVTERIAYWEVKTGQADALGRQVSGSQRETKEVAQEIKHANEILSQITLPWDKLFQAVEWSAGKEVALLAVEPDAEKHEVKISGEAKDIAAVLDYIRKLSTQEIFNSVYLQSHQVQQRAPLKPVRFALVAAWKVTP